MIDLGKHHRNRLILALLGILFFFALTANGFGDLEEYFVGDFVWSDDDCDGIQDDGEPGLEGVTVILTNPDGSEVSFVTGSDGRYEFGGLCCSVLWLSGRYTQTPFVWIVIPDGRMLHSSPGRAPVNDWS